jgi:hypothetical protein
MANPLSYLPIEVRSYLPGGWVLAEGAHGTFDAKRGVWQITVSDGADSEHQIKVDTAAAAAGRLEALRKAIDSTCRKALGKKGIFG